MAGVFKATANDGFARCGLLAMRSGSVATPTPMLYTRRGGALFLTPDLMEKLRPAAQVVQTNAMQFVQLPSPEALRSTGLGATEYMGMRGWPLLLSNRDPTLAEYCTGAKGSTAAAAYVSAYTGGVPVTPERYMEIVAALQPDMYVALADEVPGDARPKRIAQSVDRTVQWLDECMRLALKQQQMPQQPPPPQQQMPQQPPPPPPPQQQQQQQEAADAFAVSACRILGPAQQLLAPIVGAGSPQERARSAEAAAERNVAGFALCGFGAGELASARPALLSAALQHLPSHKPRVIVGLVRRDAGSPEEVLDAVAAGVDVFDCCYPTQATAAGLALCFPVTPAQEAALACGSADAAAAAAGAVVQGSEAQQPLLLDSRQPEVGAPCGLDADSGADGSKLNLWALRYSRHTRAYVHHLLNTHEMLAGVLLELHNTTWWLSFFEAVREAIHEGRLQEYRDWFRGRRAATRSCAMA